MLTEINQLLILRNFANLHIKGLGHMDLSKHIALEWHKGQGIHFACRIHDLACHYQKFQQLPPKKQGSSGGHSLFNNERVQRALRAYLTGLCIGDVTPKDFQCALNEQILPSLDYMLEVRLSECMAWCWLYKLG
jgi:hypothetical protein